MARKSNWDRIRNQKSTDTVKYRDVYEDQQLERSSIRDKETMLTRNILNIFICTLVFVLLWFIVSGIEMVTNRNGGIKMNQAPDNIWIHVNEYYENVEDSNDKITPAEYEAKVEAFKNGSIEAVEEPVAPVNPEEQYVGKYEDGEDHLYAPEFYANVDNPDDKLTPEEYTALCENYATELDAYEKQKAAYEQYQKDSVSPEERYKYQISHYRNRNNFSEYIRPEDYDKQLATYQKKLEKGKIKDVDKDIPYQPIDPAEIYVAYDENGEAIRDYLKMDKTDQAKYQVSVIRSRLDGTIITAEDASAQRAQYLTDIESFKTAYSDYMAKYYPDYEEGKLVFRVGPTKTKLLVCFTVTGVLFGFLWILLKKNLDAANLLSDTSDINQYHNDQHIALPEEVQRNYDWFPDVGAHSAVQVSSMISHMALLNKGLKKVEVAKRADKDIKDEDDNIEYFKGEILEDENGNYITTTEPMIDDKFMEDLFDASGAPNDKAVRHRYDATKIPYNPDGSNRDKLGKFETVADLINEDWEFPIYEPQRPAGAYIVDTAPVNTMVLAITRAGKGQTVIEPTIDMWMREKRPNNMVINDPKGELLVKNYVRATVRGIQVVQFNLINAMKTDIYNPLAMAADAAREGDNTKCAMYVENIAEVFFPLDGGDDPVWPNAANNAFKRAAYGLIDYYLEEEKAMRRMAERIHIDEKVLEQKIDEMWGKVTLYNCYQLFVQLSSKKMKNPAVEFSNAAKAGKYNDLSDEEYAIELEKVKNKSKLWEDKPDADLLTLYFAATDALPKNKMRTLVSNANNALKSMGGAEKMMASVYGIAITAMVRGVQQLKAVAA